MEKTLTADFNFLNHKGEAVGALGDKKISVYGALPGEKAEVIVPGGKRKNLKGRLNRIISSAPRRIPPRENHYLSCSPWQTADYDFQVELKKTLITDIFRKNSNENIKLDEFFSSPTRWGYRTKMEFSFIIENEKLCLAFNERGRPNKKLSLPGGCVLAGVKLNKTALGLVESFNKLKLTGGELKTLTLRESKKTGRIIAVLTVKDMEFDCKKLLDAIHAPDGFVIAYSDPRSPSSVITKLLSVSGESFLEEEILGKKFTYGYDGFFQNNIPLFEIAVGKIAENIPGGANIIELFSGVGVIGICLKDAAGRVTGVELSESGYKHASNNAKENNASNYTPVNAAAEKIDAGLLSSFDCLILDPPRSGTAPRLIRKISQAPPETVIYLSCNPSTQARDYEMLKGAYGIEKLYGFDFHPQTPHIESLLILKKR